MRLLFAVMLVACDAGRPPSAGPPPSAERHDRGSAPARIDVKNVERYERADGVPRDFRIAAELYAEGCAAGCGDTSACHGLLELAIANRGVTPTLADVRTAARMCKRGDGTACLALALLGFDKGVDVPQHFECTPSDHVACEAAMWTDIDFRFPSTDGPPEPLTPEQLRHQMSGPAAQLCAMGVVDGCIHVLGSCRDRACIERRAGWLKEAGVDASALFAAWQGVDRACKAGDVDACDRAGRPVPAAELCAAGDNDACGHSRVDVIKGLQAQVAALVASCHADRTACDRVTALIASDCP